MTNKLQDEVFAQMRHRLPDNLVLPPNIFVDMGGELLAFEADDRMMRVRFPFQERQQNPMGMMQGGVIAAAIDNTLGPLSYLVAMPSVTTQMNLSYIRPVTPDMPYIEVVGCVTDQTRRYVFMEGRAFDPDERLLVLAHITAMVVEAQ